MRFSKLNTANIFVISLATLLFSGARVNAGYPSDKFDELNIQDVQDVKPVKGLGSPVKGSESRKLPKKNMNKKNGMPFAEEGEVTIIVRTSTKEGNAYAATKGKNGKAKMEMKNLNLVVINVPEEEAEARMKELEKTPGIDFAEYDFEVQALPFFRGTVAEDAASRRLAENVPYGIDQVRAPGLLAAALAADMPSTTRKICVVDTGYSLGHVDLPNPDSTNDHDVDGFSPYGTSELWNVDGNSHGTHCAGSIGAIGNNNIGVIGVNDDPDKFAFHIGKGLTNSGSGSNSGVMAAVDSCVQEGAHIISMSLGGGGASNADRNAYADAYENNNVLIIAAAGNSGNSALSYPASYPHIMSVAAVDSNENIASFSQYNAQVEISGPGVGVLSTIPGNKYASYSGTSMATPHVAGVAGLVWSYFPDCTNHQIRGALIMSARDKGANGCDEEYGHGIVDAEAAFFLLKEGGCEAGNHNNGLAEGGCNQDAGPPRPTNSPTPFPCEGGTGGRVDLQTDNYPGETSWDIKNPSGIIVSQGSGYGTQNTAYAKNFCKDFNGCAMFTIKDTYGDGVCCGYGIGSYTVTLGNEVVLTGGVFTSVEENEFGCSPTGPAPTSPPTQSPTMSPTTSPTASSPTVNPTSSPTASPTTTTSPSKSPTTSPTASPTSSPTMSPTLSPTTSPTMSPTLSPTTSPTKSPTGPSTWEPIFFNAFESGWENFNSGGKGAKRNNKGDYFQGDGPNNGGDGYLEIKGNKATSLVFTDEFDISTYSKIKVDYWFFMDSFKGNDEFFLEYFTDIGPSAWVTVKKYVKGPSYENDNYYYPMEEFLVPNGATSMHIRLRCNASNKKGRIFIDDVNVEGFLA